MWLRCFSTATRVDCKNFVTAAFRRGGMACQAQRIYLDHNATSPLRPEVAAAMARALDAAGQSLLGPCRGPGRPGRDRDARGTRSRPWSGADGQERGLHERRHRGEQHGPEPVASAGSARPGATLLLVGATEHPCGLDGHRFPAARVERIPVDRQRRSSTSTGSPRGSTGARPSRRLVSVQLANNETGVIQPVAEAARLVHAARRASPCDAVQAAGKVADRHRGARAPTR